MLHYPLRGRKMLKYLVLRAKKNLAKNFQKNFSGAFGAGTTALSEVEEPRPKGGTPTPQKMGSEGTKNSTFSALKAPKVLKNNDFKGKMAFLEF